MFQIWSQRINHLIINVFLTLGIKAGIDPLPFAIFVTQNKVLLSGENKLKVLYLFTHRYCSRFAYAGACFSVSNCKHYKMCLF